MFLSTKHRFPSQEYCEKEYDGVRRGFSFGKKGQYRYPQMHKNPILTLYVAILYGTENDGGKEKIKDHVRSSVHMCQMNLDLHLHCQLSHNMTRDHFDQLRTEKL